MTSEDGSIKLNELNKSEDKSYPETSNLSPNSSSNNINNSQYSKSGKHSSQNGSRIDLKSSKNSSLDSKSGLSTNLTNLNHLKRHSLVTPINIKTFNSINNLANISNSYIRTENTPVQVMNKYYLTINSTLSHNQHQASRDKRFSFSVDKFSQPIFLLPPKASLSNIFDRSNSGGGGMKVKSQTDLSQLATPDGQNYLGSSMYNISRSCSLNVSGLEFCELKKLYISNDMSQFNGKKR